MPDGSENATTKAVQGRLPGGDGLCKGRPLCGGCRAGRGASAGCVGRELVDETHAGGRDFARVFLGRAVLGGDELGAAALCAGGGRVGQRNCEAHAGTTRPPGRPGRGWRRLRARRGPGRRCGVPLAVCPGMGAGVAVCACERPVRDFSLAARLDPVVTMRWAGGGAGSQEAADPLTALGSREGRRRALASGGVCRRSSGDVHLRATATPCLIAAGVCLRLAPADGWSDNLYGWCCQGPEATLRAVDATCW